MAKFVVVRVQSRDVEADNAGEAVEVARDADPDGWQVIGVQAKPLDPERVSRSEARRLDVMELHDTDGPRLRINPDPRDVL